MDATPINRDPRVVAILETLNNGGSIVAACRGAGVVPSTFWRWRQADPELDIETRIAIQSRIMIVEDALYQSALGNVSKGIAPNVTAQMFFLMNRDPDNWKDKRAVPHMTANATVGVYGTPDAARKRFNRNMRIVRGLGLHIGE